MIRALIQIGRILTLNVGRSITIAPNFQLPLKMAEHGKRTETNEYVLYRQIEKTNVKKSDETLFKLPTMKIGCLASCNGAI